MDDDDDDDDDDDADDDGDDGGDDDDDDDMMMMMMMVMMMMMMMMMMMDVDGLIPEQFDGPMDPQLWPITKFERGDPLELGHMSLQVLGETKFRGCLQGRNYENTRQSCETAFAHFLSALRWAFSIHHPHPPKFMMSRLNIWSKSIITIFGVVPIHQPA